VPYYQRKGGGKQVPGAKGGAPVLEVTYTVAVAFEQPELAEAWLRWLLPGHVSEVLRGGATRAEVVELDGDVRSFEVRYRFPSREAFALYEEVHAPRLRAEGARLFPAEQGVTVRRNLGTVAAEIS
jgi:hypothetical protein